MVYHPYHSISKDIALFCDQNLTIYCVTPLLMYLTENALRAETIKAKTMSEMIIFQYEYLFFQSNMFSLKNKKKLHFLN